MYVKQRCVHQSPPNAWVLLCLVKVPNAMARIGGGGLGGQSPPNRKYSQSNKAKMLAVPYSSLVPRKSVPKILSKHTGHRSSDSSKLSQHQGILLLKRSHLGLANTYQQRNKALPMTASW